ncbi:fimbria/pilus outer membrane usher protein [Enterobacter cloacae]|uniref:fimbria/pilus outer membrane usher protein n=1 Tax=Enterobacter cloacae TaxID=550 RepID=UPI002FF6B335
MQIKHLAKMISAGCQPVPLCAFVLMIPVSLSAYALADEKGVEFNTSFINSEFSNGVDFAQFSKANSMLPGQYLVDIYLNDDLVATEKMIFSKNIAGTVTECLSPELLSKLSVKASALSHTDLLTNDSCTPISAIIPSAHIKFDSSKQALTIGVPQENLQKIPRGSVSPALWQSGSAAAFASYNANTYRTETQGQAFTSQYLSLNTGVNVGGWYFRHNGSMTKQTDTGSHYQSLNSYIQHDIAAVSGRFLAGQSNTSGRLFDTVPYTGVSVFSDDNMLPESQRGYAPEIRGIARSTARVTVRQGGSVIYETTVPAGAFVINDLYPSGYGGDLNVTVRESDGSESTFLVPYASVADLLRPGANRYEAVAGKYRAQYGKDGQSFYQASWQQGLTNFLSVYTGIQFSNGYQAYQAGTAVSTPLGAIAVDVTQASTRTVNDKLTGQSYKITYNKLISDTQSNIALAAYRFSTRDYLDFSQAMQYQNYQNGDPVFSGLLYRAKNRYSLTLSQGLGEKRGLLYASGISQSYWNRSGSDMQYQLGYSNAWNSVTYSISANRSRLSDGAMDTTWLLSFSLPLGDVRPVTFSSGLSRDANGNMGQQASLSGSGGEKQQLSWGISGTHDALAGNSGGVSGQYLSPWSTFSASAGVGQNTHTLSAGLAGTVVAHPHGITLTPYTGDTWVVVHAPGAGGADVSSYPGLELDHWGNAAMPATTPYQRNVVSLNPKGLPDTVELKSTSTTVIPRSGAVVTAQFETSTGYALVLVPAPGESGLTFGSTVTDEQGNSLGLVGQSGMIYARVIEKKGKVFATNIDGEKPVTCIIPFSIEDEKSPLQRVNYVCKH